MTNVNITKAAKTLIAKEQADRKRDLRLWEQATSDARVIRDLCIAARPIRVYQ